MTSKQIAQTRLDIAIKDLELAIENVREAQRVLTPVQYTIMVHVKLDGAFYALNEACELVKSIDRSIVDMDQNFIRKS